MATNPPPPSPGPQTAADDVLALLPSWHRDLRTGCSPRTLKTYGESIRAFAAFIRALDDPPATLEDVTRDHVRDWLLALKDAGKADSTIGTRFRNLRSFLNWLVREEELSASPTANVTEPKAIMQPVPVVSREGILAMIAGCGSDFTGRRDEAMIRTLADSGLRVGELTTLRVDDIDMDQQVFWVKGKGGRDRAVPFGMKTARALDRYLRARRRHPKAAFTDRAFLSRVGGISVNRVERIIAERAEAAGLGRVLPHQFRHTAAHQVRLAGMNDQDMRRIFGWGKNSRMPERYGASAADERAREAHRRLSFGDQL